VSKTPNTLGSNSVSKLFSWHFALLIAVTQVQHLQKDCNLIEDNKASSAKAGHKLDVPSHKLVITTDLTNLVC